MRIHCLYKTEKQKQKQKNRKRNIKTEKQKQKNSSFFGIQHKNRKTEKNSLPI